MENNKKSFILHLDSLCILDDMTLEQKGILFDAIYKYQLGIEVDLDFGMKMAFAPFRNQFIRDNDKYIEFSKKQSENGKKGGRPKKQNEQQENPKNPSLFEKPKKAYNDSVSDSEKVNDNESDNEKENKSNNDFLFEKETKKTNVFSFKKKLIEYGFQENLVDDWLKVRKTKKATNTETAFKAFINEIESKDCNINEMLQIAVTNSWSGFKHKWVENLKNNNSEPTDSQHKESAISAVSAMFGTNNPKRTYAFDANRVIETNTKKQFRFNSEEALDLIQKKD